MTAELTDERLAELREKGPIISGGVSDSIRAFCELQAYRAKRETHVWVPKSPTAEMIAAAYETGPSMTEIYRAMVLAASDGNPP